MVAIVAPQESTGREHRQALELHRTRCLAVQTEQEEVEASLLRAGLDEADMLLKRRRELQDKMTWLRAQEAGLWRKADAETTRERLINANAEWVPLAEKRTELIDQLDGLADQMLPILSALDLVSEKQIDLLSGCRGLDAMTGTSIEQQTRNANPSLYAFILRKLSLLRDFPQLAARLPEVSDKSHGQEVAIQRRLFAIPKRMEA